MLRPFSLLRSSLRKSNAPFVMKRKFAEYAARTHTKPMATSTEIELSAQEAQLRDLLVDVAASIDKTTKLPEPVVLRWAGGWVRDKLLGTGSHDIDVAINVMTGLAFGEKLREFCDIPENATKHNVGPDDIGDLHKIAVNPEKSKNLETTTTRVFGLDLDFVNLRTETYVEDSRNPVVEFGTAEDDAVRRDATVNALFYNLHTKKVEDFTGGLADMKAKIIRTPLEPLRTFTDDPLRVLRLVRFASRLGFTIEPNVRNSMPDKKVLESLKVKISRERVGVELEKMLAGNNPQSALQLIDEIGLYEAIYTDPVRSDLPSPALERWHIAYRLLDLLAQNSSPASLYQTLVRSGDERYFAWSLASLAPWAHTTDPRGPVKNRPPLPVATTVAREGAKAPNKLCDVITAAQKNREGIKSLKESVCSGAEVSSQRDTLGMAIRSWDSRDAHWRVQVLYAILVDAMDRLEELPKNNGKFGPRDFCPCPITFLERLTMKLLIFPVGYPEFLVEWQKFLDHLADMDLMDVTSLRRLVDGKMLAKELGVKPGKWTGQALDVCLEWQLRNPGVTDINEAVEEVRKKKDELGIQGI